jgi:lipopolysaccharide export system permease protein
MILQRYIALSLIKGWLLALVVLASVFGLLSFIEELERTHRLYDELAAAKYTLSVLPNQLIGLMPVIALLGSIVALANLDRFNELTIISCTGFKRSQVLSAIAAPTLVLMALLWLGMEYVTPQMQQNAELEKISLRRSDSANWLPSGGVWSTDGQRYIHLGRLNKDNQPGAIKLFEFDKRGRLLRTLRAARADVGDNRDWVFHKVREKVRAKGKEKGKFKVNRYKQLVVPNLWEKNEIPTLSLERDTMNLSVLYNYISYLDETAQPVARFQYAFWQKLFMPLTVFSMVLLATPISATVTAGRDRSMGVNVGIGAVLGILFYLGAQIIFAIGQLLNWNVALVASLPGIITLGCALLLLKRMRW